MKKIPFFQKEDKKEIKRGNEEEKIRNNFPHNSFGKIRSGIEMWKCDPVVGA